MIYTSDKIEKEAILQVAQSMCVAARTAPKGRGIDNIVTAVITDEDKASIADKINEIGERENIAFFVRDAKNIRNSQAVVLLGVKYSSRGVPYCGFCGYENCAEKQKHSGICAFDITDLGIAVGSAVSIAADSRVDNRVMFTIGKAALELGLLGEEVKMVYGIPLSASGKSIYFDR
ncbi:Uncharacterized protein, contains ferredoxin domain [Peptoclostridium litorale DSM 5388]|uniref:DUF2148 domain-containing protein n=1 Tax=Peptoclostridium litorale DSM 5388 TaxID=1121324 RepID=A0A069RI39_PEPLI|nr:DUF2148 domain-containing protein [Peptoclostridium litorale]KDR96694.1 hypothetical protein CLIT_2c03000 [Peptoclostridium litorale DSM 5388]SIN67662.1 Uncharacterized protein, contains ferredoxin domain [Peptoclostridium litorale DSM 5388]